MARTKHPKYNGAVASARVEMERQNDALAWMRAQAIAIQPSVPEDASVYQLAGIISSKISLKKRRVHHRKTCTCSVVDMGYTTVVQMTLDKHCPFHKQYIQKQRA